MNKLILGDCLEKLKELPENSVDAIVTDPPYELGFMGKSWDNTGIANNVGMWGECLRVLKPGGYLLSFGGTRTYHRMASAIEDAGFEVRDMIEWVYGSGFPKSLNIGKQKNCEEWEGWGTALKPAHEPICMARKPLSEKTVAENCLKWGTGGINIDNSRVGLNGEQQPTGSAKRVYAKNQYTEDKVYGDNKETSPLGRFPANLIHDNSEEVRECFPDVHGAGNKNKSNITSGKSIFGIGDIGARNPKIVGDSGGNASRFFKSIIYTSKASKSERNKGCEELEEKISGGMAGTADQTLLTGSGNIRNNMARNNHPTVKPIKLMEYLINMVSRSGATILDPFMGSGTTGLACKNLGRDFIGIELSPEYMEIAKSRIDAKDALL